MLSYPAGSGGVAQPAPAADESFSQGAGLGHVPQGGQQQPKPVPTVEEERNSGRSATCKISGQRNVVSLLMPSTLCHAAAACCSGMASERDGSQ